MGRQQGRLCIGEAATGANTEGARHMLAVPTQLVAPAWGLWADSPRHLVILRMYHDVPSLGHRCLVESVAAAMRS